MYGIYGNIYHQYTPNISINLPYMDPMGMIISLLLKALASPGSQLAKSGTLELLFAFMLLLCACKFQTNRHTYMYIYICK